MAIDTVTWIYEFETNPIFGPLTHEVFQNGFGTGHCRAGCSLLALGELLVQPLAAGRLDIADQYRRVIAPGPQLTVWDLSREVIETAAVLREVSSATARLNPCRLCAGTRRPVFSDK